MDNAHQGYCIPFVDFQKFGRFTGQVHQHVGVSATELFGLAVETERKITVEFSRWTWHHSRDTF